MKLPNILSFHASDAGIIYELLVPAELEYFNGHFPGTPILPGVVQIGWAQSFTDRQQLLQGHVYKLEQLKFQAVIVPGDKVILRLQLDPIKNNVVFSFESVRGRHSSGRIVYGS